MNRFRLGLVLLATVPTVHAALTVTDDAGQTLTLAQPAKRIISLAPHVTELLFAAGAGERIVGAVDYSDYPPAARQIPRIGDNRQLDLERIVALKPDLLVVWRHGNPDKQLAQLKKLNIPLFYSAPRTLDALPGAVERLGVLAGSDHRARAAASGYRQRIAALKTRYAARPPLRVFYQVWHQPLYTLNNSHIASDAIRLCGGVNVFGQLALTAPVVSTEAVLAARPDAIVSGERSGRDNTLAQWQRFPSLPAVRYRNLIAVDADLLSRAGPRMIDGAEQLCRKLDAARAAMR